MKEILLGLRTTGQQQLCEQEKQIHAQGNCGDRLLDRYLATGEWPCGQQGGCAFRCTEPATCHEGHFVPGPPSEPRGDSGAGPLGPGHPSANHRDPHGRCSHEPPRALSTSRGPSRPPPRTSQPWAHDAVFQGQDIQPNPLWPLWEPAQNRTSGRAAVQVGSPGQSAVLGERPAGVSSVPGRRPCGHTLGDAPTHGGGSPEANPPQPPPRDHEEIVFAAAGAGPSVSDPHAPTNLLRAASAPHPPTPADP